MVNHHPHTISDNQQKVAELVADQVARALKSEKTFEASALELSAHIVGVTAAAVVELPVETLRLAATDRAELTRRILLLLKSFRGDPNGKISLAVPEETEPPKGEGLGELLSLDEGERRLDEVTVARKLEDWAGPVAGATRLERDYGVARSTLNRWQHAGEVVALLKGTKKHVYPVDQFIDGRPVKGLADVNKLASSPRVAWLWLSRPNPTLDGRRPIDLLKAEKTGRVVDAARVHFDFA